MTRAHRTTRPGSLGALQALGFSLFGVCSAISAQAGAAPLPDRARELLRRHLLLPRVAYVGKVHVVIPGGSGEKRERDILVRSAPTRCYRRDILDPSGEPAQTIVSDGHAEWYYDRARARVWKGRPSDPDEALLGPEEELELLLRNYDVRLSGPERAAGRDCWVLELSSKKGGGPARRLWIDREHGIALRSESYGSDGEALSSMRFMEIAYPSSVDMEPFRFSPPEGARVSETGLLPDYLELADARTLSGLQPRPPAWLPDGYVFESVNVLPIREARVLHYRYSDGLDVLSLFQCPASVRFSHGVGRRRRLRLKTSVAWLKLGPWEKVLEWRWRGQRFILVGQAPLGALRKVAESLP